MWNEESFSFSLSRSVIDDDKEIFLFEEMRNVERVWRCWRGGGRIMLSRPRPEAQRQSQTYEHEHEIDFVGMKCVVWISAYDNNLSTLWLYTECEFSRVSKIADTPPLQSELFFSFVFFFFSTTRLTNFNFPPTRRRRRFCGWNFPVFSLLLFPVFFFFSLLFQTNIWEKRRTMNDVDDTDIVCVFSSVLMLIYSTWGKIW